MGKAVLPCVKHTTLSLDISLAGPSLSGVAELRIVAPPADVKHIGFHASGLRVHSVTVEGLPAKFSLHEDAAASAAPDAAEAASPAAPADAAAAADAARADFRAALEAADEPSLDVSLPREARGVEDRDTLCVCIAYSAGPDAASAAADAAAASPLRAALATHGDFLFAWGGGRGARCWMPCVEHPAARSAYTLHLTVPAPLVAVAPGALQPGGYDASADGATRRYTFTLALPVLAAQMALAVGPFVVLPDARVRHVTHLLPPGRVRAGAVTAAVLTSALGLLETHLGVSLPLPSYTQVFLPAEAAPSAALAAPGVAFLSESLLVDERIGAEAAETHLRAAHCLAQQFFGIYLAPAAPADTWLTAGLAAALTQRVARWLLGEQEARWRRAAEAEALAEADDGALPPLCCPAGPRFGVTEAASPDVARLLDWKAAALVARLERRVGDETLAKLLRALCERAAAAAAGKPARSAATGATGATGAEGGAAADAAAAADADAGGANAASDALAAAADGVAAAAGDPRLLSTDAFMAACCRVGALDRGETAAFTARHVTGRGHPTLHCAYYYIKRRNTVEIALRMDGPPAALAAARAAAAASSATGWAPSAAVRVHEVTCVNDFVVSLGSGLEALKPYTCITKFQAPGSKKGGLTKRPPPNPDGGATGADSAESPVLWLRVDPEREWAARVAVRQAEAQWIAQLAKDKDVAAQGEAVAALRAHAARGSYCAVNALAARLRDVDTFCRVRAAAAVALGASASARTAFNGLDALVRFYKSSYFEPTLGRPAAAPFADLGEAAVARAALAGLAAARGTDGRTPPEAYDVLLEVAAHPDDSGAAHDGGGHTAAALRALAAAAPPSRQALRAAAAAAERHLARDRLLPSHRNTVSAAALQALGAFASFSGSPARAAARAALRRFLAPGNSPPVRRAAAAAALAIALGAGSDAAAGATAADDPHPLRAEAVAAALIEAVARATAEANASMAARLLEDAAAMLLAAAERGAAAARERAAAADVASGSDPAAAPPPIKLEEGWAGENDAAGAAAAESLRARMPPLALPAGSDVAAAAAWLRRCVRDAAAPARLQHAAFALLQVAAGRPPTLYDADVASVDPPLAPLLGAPPPPAPPPPALPPPQEQRAERAERPERVRPPPQERPRKRKATVLEEDEEVNGDGGGGAEPSAEASPGERGRGKRWRGPPPSYKHLADDAEDEEEEPEEDSDADEEEGEGGSDDSDFGGGRSGRGGRSRGGRRAHSPLAQRVTAQRSTRTRRPRDLHAEDEAAAGKAAPPALPKFGFKIKLAALAAPPPEGGEGAEGDPPAAAAAAAAAATVPDEAAGVKQEGDGAGAAEGAAAVPMDAEAAAAAEAERKARKKAKKEKKREKREREQAAAAAGAKSGFTSGDVAGAAAAATAGTGGADGADGDTAATPVPSVDGASMPQQPHDAAALDSAAAAAKPPPAPPQDAAPAEPSVAPVEPPPADDAAMPDAPAAAAPPDGSDAAAAM